jgi:hypothetical protein
LSDESVIPPEDLDDSGNPRTVQMRRQDIRALEKQAKRAADLDAELATLRRERAFMSAGVPVDDPAARYFVKGYDGELDPDAIKAAAVESKMPWAKGEEIGPEEQAAHEAAQAAAAGGTPPGAGPNMEAELAAIRQKFPHGGDEAIAAVDALVRKHGVRIPT